MSVLILQINTQKARKVRKIEVRNIFRMLITSDGGLDSSLHPKLDDDVDYCPLNTTIALVNL